MNRVVRALAKRVLDSRSIGQRLERYYAHRNEAKIADRILRGFVFDRLIGHSLWLFTQRKAGTTLLCNALAFYNAERRGVTGYDFDDIGRLGVVRLRRTDEAKSIDDALTFLHDDPGSRLVLHTHYRRPGSPWRTVLLTRNPFDFCVSAYHYFFADREGGRGVERQAAIDEVIAKFARAHHEQRAVLAEQPDALVVRYEELVAETPEVVGRVVRLLHGDVDEGALARAIEASSAGRLREHERRSGQAIVARDDFARDHFIRSGKIGEHREFFSDAELAATTRTLERLDVDLDGDPRALNT